jgi:tripartite motif-containing protein 71
MKTAVRRLALMLAVTLALVPGARANEFVRHFGGPGSGNGQFSSPLGVAVNPGSGDLYVTDSTRNLVEKFDSSGSFEFSFGGAGTGPGQFTTPRGVAVDPGTGDVYVADLNNNRVEKFDSAGQFKLQFGSAGSGAGQFNHPNMVAIDTSNGDVYVTDLTNARVEKFDPDGNFLAQFGSAGSGNGQFNAPNGVAVDPSNSDVYVTDFNNQRVEKFTSGGTFVSAFGASGSGPGQFGGPFGVAVDSATGDVYVSDGNRRVQKFDSAGNYLSQFGSAGSGDGQFNGPVGVAVDISGNVYVADGTNTRVDEFDSSSNFLSGFGGTGTGNGQFSNAVAAAVDTGTGELYAVDGGPANRVEKFTATGAFESGFGTTGTGAGQFTNPGAPAVDGSSGDVYVVDSGNNRVERFDPSGLFISQLGAAGSGNGQFSSPTTAAVDPATHDVYVVDESNHRVEKFNPAGAFLSAFGSNGTGPGQFGAPFGIAVDPADGSVYVSDVTGNRVQKFDGSGSFLLQFGGTGTGSGQFAAPRGMVVDPSDGHLFVLDGGHARIEEFSSRGRYLSQFGAPGNVSGQFNSPLGLALDPVTRAVYVVSNGGTAHVQKFGAPPAPVCASATGFTTEAFAVAMQLSCTGSPGFNPGYQVATAPAHGTISDFNPYTGFFVYTPASGFIGTDTFTYHGWVDGAQSPDRTVSVSVAAVPHCQDVSASVGENSTGGVQLACTDDSGSALSYTIDSNPSHGILGAVSPSGAVTYTPTSGFTGVDSFTYHATNADGVSSTLQVAHVTVNPPPTCEDTFLTTAAGAKAIATFECVDVAGATLNYAVFSPPAHGTLGKLNQSTGRISYTPSPGFSGTDSFTYAGSSTNGTSALQTVHITVNPPPVCQDGSASTGQGKAVVIALDCSDATGAGVHYSIVSAPADGSLSALHQAAGEVSYTPVAGFHGSDSFTYRATSVNGTSNTATVSVTVNPLPTCQNRSVTTGAGLAAVVTLSCSDPSATVTYAVDTQPAHGTLGSVAQSSGQVTYTPNPGYTGADSFTYHASSADGSSTIAIVSITVNPPPACQPVAAATTENHAAITLQLACSDSTTAPVTYAIDGGPANGSLSSITQATGQVDYAPNAGFSGVDTFTYRATSANGSAAPRTVAIRVRPVAGLGTPADGSQTNDSTPRFSGHGSTGESDASTISVAIVAGSSLSGTLVQTLHADISPTGAWSVSPTAALADGVYTARAQQSDAAGLTGRSSTHTFTVDTVAPQPTLVAPASCSSTTNTTPTFSGAAGTAAGDLAAVTVKVFAGIGVQGTVAQTLTPTAGGGAWSAPASPALPGGTYTAQASQKDQADNTGVAPSTTFNITTTAVLVTSPATCTSTTNPAPTFSGTASNNAGDSSTVTVKVFSGFSITGTPVQTRNATRSGGTWSVAASPALAPGTYTVQASQTLAGGSSTSPAVRFTVKP